jgi:hypothetical protein
MDYKDSFEYDFIVNFAYAKGGDQVEAQNITVMAPSNKLLKQISIIESEYRKSENRGVQSLKNIIGDKAMKDMLDIQRDKEAAKKEKTDSESEKDELTPDGVINTMLGNGAKMAECYAALKIILSSALVDGETKLTSTMFDDMAPVDTKQILGLYIINFLAISQ